MPGPDAADPLALINNDIVTVTLGRRAEDKAEYSGSHVDYYKLEIPDPKRLDPYTCECEDIIEALNMTFAEGCAFKAIWRSAAARTLGLRKKGQDEHGIYDAEKVSYYGQAMLRQRKRRAAAAKK
jgi:hypothetical protein